MLLDLGMPYKQSMSSKNEVERKCLIVTRCHVEVHGNFAFLETMRRTTLFQHMLRR